MIFIILINDFYNIEKILFPFSGSKEGAMPFHSYFLSVLCDIIVAKKEGRQTHSRETICLPRIQEVQHVF